MNIGDSVKYSVKFLRSTGQYVGNVPHAAGVITSVKNYGGLSIATIKWNYPDVPEKVNVKNLVLLKNVPFENPARKNPLADDRFYKGTFNYRTEANGPVKHAPRFTYETGKALYDVIQFPQGTQFRTNGFFVREPHKIHNAVIHHFSIDVRPWVL